MKMQDNEFDDIFRSQMENFEAEPSEKVWTGIDDELDSLRSRKVWVPILRVAAVLVVIGSAGVLIIQQHQTTIPDNKNKPALAINHPAITIKPAKVEPAKQIEPVVHLEPLKREISEPVNTIAKVVTVKKNNKPSATTQVPSINNRPQGSIEQPEPIMLVAVTPSTEIKTHVVPDNDVPLATKDPVQIANNIDAKPALTAQVPPSDQPAKQVKRRGIHSFGDLVNLVANKVEKQRSASALDDDDDDSAVAKINRGIQRVRKEREQESAK